MVIMKEPIEFYLSIKEKRLGEKQLELEMMLDGKTEIMDNIYSYIYLWWLSFPFKVSSKNVLKFR